MLLVHPPVAKPCEPPPGIAQLAGALKANGVSCEVLDASLEGLLYLMKKARPEGDRWTGRALAHREDHLTGLRSWPIYGRPDAYRRAVADLNRLVHVAGRPSDAGVSLGNFLHADRSPVRSSDLTWAATHPEANPFHGYFAPRLKELLENRPVTWVGVSVNFLSQALCAWAMMGSLRREFPGIRIVVGGGLITSWMRGALEDRGWGDLVDAWVAGPGEEPLLELLGVRSSPGRSTPDYSLFREKGYLAPGFILPYSASSGCYWNRCAFCPEKSEGNPYRPVSPEKALEELDDLCAENRPVLVHLLDNALSPALLKRLAVRGLPRLWYGFSRLTPPLDDLDFCLALRRGGCVMLKLGLESGDQGVLDALDKGIRLDAASRILANLKTAGIATYVYLLFGTPAEGPVEAQRTLDFIAAHHAAITFLNVAVFNLPLQSLQARTLETTPFYEGDLSLYRGFRHPTGWHRGKVRRFLDKTFRQHPEVAAILRRDPPVFTSNHAPLFSLAREQAD
ncbi:MAG: radical SAM protein [Deltaproteobacteria bacterium]|nr:radical SAM protein [Deltaproteobacteria bacterium]